VHSLLLNGTKVGFLALLALDFSLTHDDAAIGQHLKDNKLCVAKQTVFLCSGVFRELFAHAWVGNSLIIRHYICSVMPVGTLKQQSEFNSKNHSQIVYNTEDFSP